MLLLPVILSSGTEFNKFKLGRLTPTGGSNLDHRFKVKDSCNSLNSVLSYNNLKTV